MSAMHIRPETPDDVLPVAETVTAAFRASRHGDQNESAIIVALRAAGVISLSLVADGAGSVLGHAAFSKVTINGESRGWFGLGPVAIDRSGRATGSAAP